MSLLELEIANSTKYVVSGYVYEVEKNIPIPYTVEPYKIFTLPQSGIYFKEISAEVQTPNGNIVATPFVTSVYIDHGQFTILQTGSSSYKVRLELT